jgi:hypothetical protein
MPNAIFLGSDVVIISMKDARKLVRALLGLSTAKVKELQELGILGILTDLDSAIRRYDWEKDDA